MLQVENESKQNRRERQSFLEKKTVIKNVKQISLVRRKSQ